MSGSTSAWSRASGGKTKTKKKKKAPGAPQHQDEFIAQHRASWSELEDLLTSSRELHRKSPYEISRVATLYRSVCADLMRARSNFGPDVVRYLEGLAGRAHNALYGARAYRLSALWELVAHHFPRTLRKRWRFFLIANLLLWVPYAFGFFGTLASIEFAETVLPRSQLMMMEAMYTEGFEAGRDAATDSEMAGFYIFNNVGIAFRCFATGILFGLGSIFYAVYNGVVMGVSIGWVVRVGYGHNIMTFVCGHSPFEMTAIVISTGAGLQMGWALIKTDGLTRLGSLRSQAGELGHLIMGAAVMLVIAAFIEGYWSPSSVPAPIKWAVSGLNWTLVGAWLFLGGRWAGRKRVAAAGAPPPPSAASADAKEATP